MPERSTTVRGAAVGLAAMQNDRDGMRDARPTSLRGDGGCGGILVARGGPRPNKELQFSVASASSSVASSSTGSLSLVRRVWREMPSRLAALVLLPRHTLSA